MNNRITKIGLGGSCHWCTEAIFLSLKGVVKVEQGWIASNHEAEEFSEGIIIHFDSNIITIRDLIEIHLHTHSSAKIHSRRFLYRSAVYTFSNNQFENSKEILSELQNDFQAQIITQIMPYRAFKPSREAIQNYYYKNPEKEFCRKYINPKLELLLKQFASLVEETKLTSLIEEK